ncbi:copper homeostasis periplasmic binding protein CopC [Sphingomonas solaris]|uniref:Copper homeostasis periplasmic binding protein CopC n=1 Tax=Alterirhizorhabdus solaris TaxID=2529389 RepID=A0A558R4D4_9SPHN|nr:copper homeostasis periplasmic binding protein CopC [Sphingomonas solaris]TVV74254.1 copper homeostasis periplasmic binding protein CopC [Sphingomonas solaris]
MFARITTALFVAALATAPALAHPKLASALPAADSAGPAPAKIQLKFTEKLVPQFSTADLMMTGMPGMAAHQPMKVKQTTMVAPDGLTLVTTPTRPLPAGTYKLSYKVVSADTHKIDGGYSFTVK